MKSITFLMPTTGQKGPAGGYKVVYEYANRLVNDGYDVHIAYPLTMEYRKEPLMRKLRAFPRLISWLLRGYDGRDWFPLDKRIKTHLVLSLNYRHVPHTDAYVATGVKTAYYLYDYPTSGISKNYLIQDYETWGVSDQYVNNSYKLGLTNITISNWLSDKVKDSGAEDIVIKNGFDFNYFRLTNPISDRNPLRISMLYHRDERKGCSYGIEALKKVKLKYPALKVSFFGVPDRPADLPDWIEYYQRPDKDTHNRIYNESAIYLAPSLQEGWGLTVGEAMICGAAVVCTDTLGFHEMITDRENGIIVPIADSDALAASMLELIGNQTLRIRLAEQGNSDIQAFTWENSYKKFKSLF